MFIRTLKKKSNLYSDFVNSTVTGNLKSDTRRMKKYSELINESTLTLPQVEQVYDIQGEIDDFDSLRKSWRPKYFYIIKYFLSAYIIIHILFMIITLPYGIADLRSQKHQHTQTIHALWIISIIYSSSFSGLGLVAILRESFSLCVVYCIAMFFDLLLLVYAATLHQTQTTPMVLVLLANWFFTCVAIAYTKLLDNMRYSHVHDTFKSSPGYLHAIYVRQSKPIMQTHQSTVDAI